VEKDRVAFHRTKLLFVVDDKLLLGFFSDLAAAHGFQPLIAAGGPSGIAMAKRERPDLILLDVMMPAVDGFEVCRQMRADPELKDTPIVIITAMEDPKLNVKGFAVVSAGSPRFSSPGCVLWCPMAGRGGLTSASRSTRGLRPERKSGKTTEEEQSGQHQEHCADPKRLAPTRLPAQAPVGAGAATLLVLHSLQLGRRTGQLGTPFVRLPKDWQNNSGGSLKRNGEPPEQTHEQRHREAIF
jgi:CheY-like chemotaxis protein